MSDLEERPAVELCHAAGDETSSTITGRTVVLGRTQEVTRLLPDRRVRMIGAWCFCDHYGPEAVTETGGMRVWPHPHTGLATVSWLFSGEIEHRDSMGHHVRVRPGELTIMTGGYGVVHSEMTPVAVPGAPVGDDLHGVQLWIALPEGVRNMAPALETVTDLPTASVDGVEVRVLVGSLAGVASPATVQSPLVAAQLDLAPGTSYELVV
ncbi:MAG: pirin family protein, partial [Propionibacteriales bacterium]|nr:pirin family protein [Propionibacteriales bacterium]